MSKLLDSIEDFETQKVRAAEKIMQAIANDEGHALDAVTGGDTRHRYRATGECMRALKRETSVELYPALEQEALRLARDPEALRQVLRSTREQDRGTGGTLGRYVRNVVGNTRKGIGEFMKKAVPGLFDR